MAAKDGGKGWTAQPARGFFRNTTLTLVYRFLFPSASARSSLRCVVIIWRDERKQPSVALSATFLGERRRQWIAWKLFLGLLLKGVLQFDRGVSILLERFILTLEKLRGLLRFYLIVYFRLLRMVGWYSFRILWRNIIWKKFEESKACAS